MGNTTLFMMSVITKVSTFPSKGTDSLKKGALKNLFSFVRFVMVTPKLIPEIQEFVWVFHLVCPENQ